MDEHGHTRTSTDVNKAPCHGPQRIQRKRTKGWRMPPNTVYVGRGSLWGNPFKVGDGVSPEVAVCEYEHWLTQGDGRLFFGGIDLLRGKNLACWCALSSPCHADVLLRLANGEGMQIQQGL